MRFTLVFGAVVILFSSAHLSAQWVEVYNEHAWSFATVKSGILAGTTTRGMQKSTNNGSTWATNFSGANVRSIEVVGSTVFAGWAGGVAKSTNNGQNWILTLNENFTFALHYTGGRLYAGTLDSGVFVSTNLGQTWSQTSLVIPKVFTILSKGTDLYAGTSLNGIFKSTNNGANWVQTGLNGYSVRTLSLNGQDIYAGTEGFGLFRSTDDGQSWVSTTLDTGTVYSIAMEGSNIFAGVSWSLEMSGVYRSTNNGQDWEILNEGMTLPFIWTLYITGNYMFASNEVKIWRRPLSELVNINNLNTQIPTRFILNQNYPNPFNPSTKISFAVSKKGHVKMLVYDHLSREVAALINDELSPGTYEKEFDGSNLSSGIYYYKLITREFSETKKMVLVK